MDPKLMPLPLTWNMLYLKDKKLYIFDTMLQIVTLYDMIWCIENFKDQLFLARPGYSPSWECSTPNTKRLIIETVDKYKMREMFKNLLYNLLGDTCSEILSITIQNKINIWIESDNHIKTCAKIAYEMGPDVLSYSIYCQNSPDKSTPIKFKDMDEIENLIGCPDEWKWANIL